MHLGWACDNSHTFLGTTTDCKYITLDVGIARRKGKSGWYFFGIPKSNIRSNLNKKWQWGRAHTCFDLNRTFESHPASWCPCIGRRHITPENVITIAIKIVLGLFASFASHYFELTGIGILARMGDMKAERPTRMKMTTWVTLNYIFSTKSRQDEVSNIGPQNSQFHPKHTFRIQNISHKPPPLEISQRNHLFSRTPKNLGFSPGAAVSVSIFRLYKGSLIYSSFLVILILLRIC